MSTVNEVEKEYGASIFVGHAVDVSSCLDTYIRIRNEIIQCYRKDSTKFLSAEECAQLLSWFRSSKLTNAEDDDPSLVLKIHTLLDYWGFINFYARDFSSIRVNYKTQFAKRGAQNSGPITHKDDELVENAIKPFTVFKATTDSAIEPWEELKSNRKCSGCGNSCKFAYYILTTDLAIAFDDWSIWCGVCYSNSNYLTNVAKHGFVRVTVPTCLSDYLDGTNINSSNWNAFEMERLYRAIEQNGTDWRKVAKNLNGDISPTECMLKIMMAPLTSEVLSKVKLPVCFNTYSNVGKSEDECAQGGKAYDDGDGDEGDRNKEEEGNKPENSAENGDGFDDSKIPFETSPNSMIALLSFLAGVVSPIVASGSARAAMQYIISHAKPIRPEASEQVGLDGSMDQAVGVGVMRKATRIALEKAIEISADLVLLEQDRLTRELANLIDLKLERVTQKLAKLTIAETNLENDLRNMDRNLYQLLRGNRSPRRNHRQAWRDSVRAAKLDIFGSLKGFIGESDWTKPLEGPSRTNWYWPSKYLHQDFSLRHYLGMQINRFKPKTDSPAIIELAAVTLDFKKNRQAIKALLETVDLATFKSSSTLQDVNEIYFALFNEPPTTRPELNEPLEYLKNDKWAPFISYLAHCSEFIKSRNDSTKSQSSSFNINKIRQLLLDDENLIKCLQTRARFVDALYLRRRAYYLSKLQRKRNVSETVQRYKRHFLEHPDHKTVWPDSKGVSQHQWPSKS